MKFSLIVRLFAPAFAVVLIVLLFVSVHRGEAVATELSAGEEWKASELSAYLYWLQEGAPGIDPETKVSLNRNEVPDNVLTLAKAHEKSSRERMRKLVEDIEQIAVSTEKLSVKDSRGEDGKVERFLEALEQTLDKLENEQKKRK